MKKLLIATSTALVLLAGTGASFAEQENQNMDLKEARRTALFMMTQMLESNMAHMKAQEEMMTHMRLMLQQMIQCEDKNLRDGQNGC